MRKLSEITDKFIEITLSPSGIFIMDETYMMIGFDREDYWQKRRHEELIKEYVQIVGKDKTYWIRGNIMYGKNHKEQIEAATRWAIWYDKNAPLPKYILD